MTTETLKPPTVVEALERAIDSLLKAIFAAEAEWDPGADEVAREAISLIGKKLFERGGVDQMRASMRRVVGMDIVTFDRRTDILSVSWDGIGARWGDRWWS